MKNLKPDHNTIARFRKDNPKAIKRVFRYSVEIAKNFNLIGGILIAGDKIPQKLIEKEINIVAKASFGFGDVNGCLIFKKFKKL